MFLFEKKIAEKLHKPKRKETVTEILRQSVKEMERFRHPKILQIIHPVEESADTLAFATEPILASLANILSWQEFRQAVQFANQAAAAQQAQNGGQPLTQQQLLQQQAQQPQRPAHAKEYVFLDIELKYGLLQVSVTFIFTLLYFLSIVSCAHLID